MEKEKDVRWQQRFANYQKALSQLSNAINENSVNPIDIIKEGIIQRFEFTHELAWKVMGNYLKEEGFQNIIGSKTATQQAFNVGLINNGQIWMDMIDSRNKTVHTYHQNILEIEYQNIVNIYFPQFINFETKMKTLL